MERIPTFTRIKTVQVMKKIIYTTDYSQNSVAALRYAVTLGEMMETDVIVLHIYDPAEQDKETHARKIHQERLTQFCKDHLGEQFSSSLVSVAAVKGNNAPRAILDFVRDLEVSMIVMGACGTSTLKEMFIGSTTKEMTAISPFPVVAVPANHKPFEVKEIMFPSTLEVKDIKNIQELIRILSPLKPEIHVVHVTHKEQEEAEQVLTDFRKKAQDRLHYANLDYRLIHSQQVYEAIKQEIEDSKPDMVVVRDYPDKNEVNRLIIRDKLKWIQSCTSAPILNLPIEK